MTCRKRVCARSERRPRIRFSRTLKFFRDEYEEHIREHRCRAGVCKALTKLYIDAEKCIACGKCIPGCPTEAITGAKKIAHVIDQSKCIVCGSCAEVCPSDAVCVEPARTAEEVHQ